MVIILLLATFLRGEGATVLWEGVLLIESAVAATLLPCRLGLHFQRGHVPSSSGGGLADTFY